MNAQILQVDISKLFLHRKLFLVWILVVFLPFALVIAIFSAPSLLIQGIASTSEAHPSLNPLRFDLPQAPVPQPTWLVPLDQQPNISNYSLLHTDGLTAAGSLKKSPKPQAPARRNSKDNVTAADIIETKLKKKKEKCNLFKGNWIPDPEGPLYTNESCAYIQGHQNCLKNGRPDRAYLNWRWKPKGCTLPRFNATAFLELVRGKVWGFVGDSVARNQMQSLVCLLSQVEHPNKTYQDKDNIFVHWLFPSYNFTLMVLWSPYLVEQTLGQFKGVPEGTIKLHLDVLDSQWVTLLPHMDVIILCTGQWFLKPGVYIMEDNVVGCHRCPGIDAQQLGFYFAFRNAIRATLEGIRLMPGFSGIAFLETFTVDHFENGTWDSGGTCQRTLPYNKSEVRLDGVNKEMHEIVAQEYRNGTKDEAPNGCKVKLVDITYCGLLRPDGHPGAYRDTNQLSQIKDSKSAPNDCLHWCLPGPIDTWNEILLQMIREV